MVQCLPDDMVDYVIEQYRKKTGDKLRYKNVIFNDFNVFPSQTVENAGLYNNVIIYVYQ